MMLRKSSSVMIDRLLGKASCQILYIVLGTYVQKILNPNGTCRWTSKLQRTCSVNSLELDERAKLKLIWLLYLSYGRDGR